ncbi:hypothetical protein Z043_120717 [Scleropages formosus]|uniref:UBC core domain-containing protein n=1 Tax=Scleropages formosus TaxID=113540 RepID=A0A0P7Y682_SCLFO|nr:hypothetical protein Z043_120717 [Scleropages formosus]
MEVEKVLRDTGAHPICLGPSSQHLYNVESEIEETDYDSVDGSSSGASSEEWEDESDSWVTDNGPTEEEPPGETAPAPTPTGAAPDEGKPAAPYPATVQELEGAIATAALAGAGGSAGGTSGMDEKAGKEGTPRGFRELKEALKILESLKNMTVEQLWTGSPTSPTVEPEKPTKEKRFLDDIKKLQENLKKTLDNVAIVEEERMEAVGEVDKEEKQLEPQTPVRSEWPSDTPVLCQQSGGKPGVTFTSAKGEVFSVLEWAPDTHAFKKMEFQPAEAKKFFSTVRKEMALLATSLPDGIMVKTFEDRMANPGAEARMDLFSALIKGPTRTPYEDGLFLFDIQLPNIYPAVPPLFRYLSQCSGRLNPNLYDNGKVCVSLLGTWIGKVRPRPNAAIPVLAGWGRVAPYPCFLLSRCLAPVAGYGAGSSSTPGLSLLDLQGTERWTSKSSLLQVLISIQELRLLTGLVMPATEGGGTSRFRFPLERCALPAAGPTAAQSVSEGYENSRCYNEMALIKMVQSMTQLLQHPVERSGYPDIGFPLFPLSKGFVKSVRGVLQHYRAALLAAGFPERREDK